VPGLSANLLRQKFKAYFEMGVRSCWFVTPDQGIISVYSKPNRWKNFGPEDSEVIDEVMDIRLPIQKVFYWFFDQNTG
jgi:hypothetical protein